MFLNKMLSQSAAVERYGAIDLSSRQWPDMDKWMVLVDIPKAFPNFTIMETGIPVTHISCNRDIASPLRRALDSVVVRGLANLLFTYDGCFCIRGVRGVVGALSTHSYGLAIDLNAQTNPLGATTFTKDAGVIECFQAEGFDWGGKFKRCDPMHFSYAWEEA